MTSDEMPHGGFAFVYATADDTLAHPIPRQAREALWSGIAPEQALGLIASILRDYDDASSTSEPRRAVDVRWAQQIQSPTLRASVLDAIRAGKRWVAPQLLLLAAAEAIECCRGGAAKDNLDGLDDVIQCVLGIADEAGSPPAKHQKWGGLDLALAAEIIANGHFNQAADAAHLMSWTLDNWLSPWPDKVPASAVSEAGGSPAELFREATGIDIHDFVAVALHVWTQASLNRFVRYPAAFFDAIGLSREATDRFLAATAISISDLKDEVQKERQSAGGSLWAFNAMRRWPLVELEDGTWLVLRLGFLLERTLSETTYWDVHSFLQAEDAAHGTNRLHGFRTCIEASFEAHVGSALRRMFPSVAGHPRVFSEADMQRAWRTRRGMPSVCDFAVDCGPIWLLFDATTSRLRADTVNATADASRLDEELSRVVTDRKVKQFASTIRLLRGRLQDLVRRQPIDLTWYVPIVVVPNSGLGWSPGVSIRSEQMLAESGVLRSVHAHRVATMTVRDLRALESAVEQGADASRLLADWRTGSHGLAFNQFVGRHPRYELSRPERERAAVDTVMEEAVNLTEGRLGSKGGR